MAYSISSKQEMERAPTNTTRESSKDNMTSNQFNERTQNKNTIERHLYHLTAFFLNITQK